MRKLVIFLTTLLISVSAFADTFYVHYTAYEKDSSFIINEGVIQIQAQQQYQAENMVKAMFPGANVIIRYTTQNQ